MNERFQIPKGLQPNQKVLPLGPLVLDKRQFIVLGAAFLLYYVLYKKLTQVIPLTLLDALIIFSPLVFAAVAVAFVPIQGRHLDFWVSRMIQNAFSPSVYLFAREPRDPDSPLAFAGAQVFAASKQAPAKGSESPSPNGSATGGRSAPHHVSPQGSPKGQKGRKPKKDPKKPAKAKAAAKAAAKASAKTGIATRKGRAHFSRKRPKKARTTAALRASVQKILGVDGLFYEMLRTTEGDYLAIVEVEPVKMNLTGETDQARILAAAAGLYNRLNFEIVEMTRAREGDVRQFCDELREVVIDVVKPHEQELAHTASDHLAFLDEIVKSYNVHDRKSYFIIPYRPGGAPQRGHRSDGFLAKLLTSLGIRPTKTATRRLQAEAKEAYHTLGARYDLVADFCKDAGAEARLMHGHKLLEFVKDQTCGEKHRPAARLYSPMTLETHGYGGISERSLAKRASWAEEERGPEPPAVGLGEVGFNDTFADKVSPQALRVHRDYVRADGRYHATMYVKDFGPDVGLGDLRSVLNIPGRVKILKYIRPVPQHKAVKRAGAAWAELEAAARNADNGDLIVEADRDRSRQHARIILNELQTGNQRLFDVAVLVHCEADTKEELYNLTDKIQKKLEGRRIEALLAREESLKGFRSSLPFGKMELTESYARRPIITNPLACFFLHGTYAVDHTDGILLGVDYNSAGLVVLNTRRLTNPHLAIIATSGAGKTVAVKTCSTRQRFRGQRIVIVDPVGDSRYAPVCKAMNGQYVPLGVGSRFRINPCDMGRNYMNISVFTGAADHMSPEEYEETRKAALTGALDGKCLMLTRQIGLMLNDLTSAEENWVDRAWRELYEDFGITDDQDTHANTPPTMPDFYKKIQEPRFREHLADVYERLYIWREGSLRSVFSGHTNVDLDNPYLVLQIANVQGRAKAAIMYGVLEFLNGRLSDRTEPSNCYVDEFWSLLKYEMAAEFAEEMFRSGRARNNAMIPVTQDIAEFLGSEAGQVIFKLCASRLLLKQNRKTAEILSEFVPLSENQIRQLETFHSGQAYLMVEENLVPMKIAISRKEHALFNTDPENDDLARPGRRRDADDPAHHDRLPGGAVRDPLDVTRRILEEGEPQDNGSRRAAPTTRLTGAPVAAVGDASAPIAPTRRAPVPAPTLPAGVPPVYAVVGREAPLVAWNLSGLVARAIQLDLERAGADGSHGSDASRKPLVLFADAEGSTTASLLLPGGFSRPDALLADREGGANLRDFVRRDEQLRFAALACPEDGRLPAENVLGAIEGGPYACVVVACPERFDPDDHQSMYVEDWLTAASRVVAAGPADLDRAPDGDLLGAALSAEELRGANGTLLAPLGSRDAAALARNLDPSRQHHLYPLPAADSAAFARAAAAGAFAALDDAQTAAAFEPLARALLLPTETATALAAHTPAQGGTA